MPKVRAHTLVPGPVSAAEALWHDLRRWPSFVDGLARLDKTEGSWPEPGARVIWSGLPGEAARVVEVTGGLVAVNPNTMYPLLRRLEADGLVAAEWEHPERRSRRFYALTPAGRARRAELAAEVAPHLDAVARAVALVRAELGLAGAPGA